MRGIRCRREGDTVQEKECTRVRQRGRASRGDRKLGVCRAGWSYLENAIKLCCFLKQHCQACLPLLGIRNTHRPAAIWVTVRECFGFFAALLSDILEDLRENGWQSNLQCNTYQSYGHGHGMFECPGIASPTHWPRAMWKKS